MQAHARPRVIIVGAGFGGLYAAKSLRHAPVDVLLMDAHNYPQFQPDMYHVGTAALDARDVAHQVRSVFKRQGNLRCRMGRVTRVHEAERQGELEGGERLDYDYL